MFFGTKIIFSPYCLADTEVRNFPPSRHRSTRVYKKLIKRYGSEFRKEPAIYKMPDGSIIAHPAFKAKIYAATKS